MTGGERKAYVARRRALPMARRPRVPGVRLLRWRMLFAAVMGMLLLLGPVGVVGAVDPTVPAKPGAPSLRVVSTDTIDVNWNTPADGGSALIRYVLEYYRSGDDFSISQLIEHDESRPIRLAGLRPASTYHVRLAAVNLVGVGEYSDETSVRLILGAFEAGALTEAADGGTLPRVIGRTGAATTTEIAGDRLIVERHDGGVSLEFGVGWIARDGSSQVVVGFIRDADLGQTYSIVRYEDNGMIVRRWISPQDPVVYSVPWALVNTRYTVPVGVITTIPLDHRFPVHNQLARRFDGEDVRIFAFDAGVGRWRHIPDYATFQALGFYWCNVGAADSTFFDRVAQGDPYTSVGVPERANYPNCAP